MTDLPSDYQQQLTKLRRYNRRVLFAGMGLMLILFFALTGYAIWAGQKDNRQTQEILDYIEQTQQVSSSEAQISRQGGDIIRCILDYPATSRTQEQINMCHPGGSQESWLQYRKEVLGE